MIKKMLTIGTIKDLKSGISPKTNKPWTLHLVECHDDEGELDKFTTFNTYNDMVGQKVAVLLEKEINGKFTNWKEANKSSEAKAAQGKFEEEIKEALRIINGKIDRLLTIKNSIDDYPEYNSGEMQKVSK